MIRFLPLLFAVVLVSCEQTQSADRKQVKATEEFMAEAERQIGMPAVTNFQERRLAKMIFELRDQADLLTHAYIVNLEGKLIYLGECIGFGLPYSVQYTNPMRRDAGVKGAIALPQPDPNGLFMPEGLSATWLMMRDPTSGEVRPVYVEPQIIVSPFKLT